MVHGMGFRDHKHLSYWGRIGKRLEEHGAKIYYGYQDSNGNIEGNSRQLEKSLKKVLEETGAEKVNIIAHSKGGLESRYLISTMGYADKIASLTTMSTPHNGSVTVDKLLRFTRPLVWVGCLLVNLWFFILGDKHPDTYGAIKSFETANARKFNEDNPDSESVYYQSYSFVMDRAADDIFMIVPWLVVNVFEGKNDGLLPPASTKWTNYKGVRHGSGKRGISHLDEVDFRRSNFSKNKTGDISDITEFYLQVAAELEAMGF